MDLGPIKVHKTRRNSLHSHTVGFTVDENGNKTNRPCHSHYQKNIINDTQEEINNVKLVLDCNKITNSVSVDIIEITPKIKNNNNKQNNSDNSQNWSSGSDSSYSQIDDVSSLAVKVKIKA